MTAHLQTTELKLSEPREAKAGMKMATVSRPDESPLVFRLPYSRVLFEPSVFKGTGEEPRKGIVLALTDEEAQHVQALEEAVRKRLQVPPERWTSSLRRDERASLKAKINVAGERLCSFQSPAGENKPPEPFKGRDVEVVVHVRAAYLQKQSNGLVLDVVAMRYGEVSAAPAPDWWSLAA
jgi:hypothetical protein